MTPTGFRGRLRGGLRNPGADPGERPTGAPGRVARRTFGLFRPFAGRLLLIVVLVAITSTLNLVPALLFGEMLDTATAGNLGGLQRLFAAVLGIYLLSGLLGVLRGYLNQTVGQDMMVRLRDAMHSHLQRLSVRFYHQTKTGEILTRVTADVNAVQQVVTTTFAQFLINVWTLVAGALVMLSLDWRLALIVIGTLPLWVYPTLRVGDRMRRLQLEWRDESANMTAHLAETLSVSGSMVVKTFGRQGFEAQRFRRSNQTLRSLSIQRFLAGRWFNTSTELFGSISVAFIYWFGARSVVTGGVETVGDVVAFAMVAQRILGPFRQIARINTTVLASLALFERIFEYLDLPVEVDERPGALALPRATGRVRFERVRFGYAPSARPALVDVSFDVEPGRMLALVGPSGAGKTTAIYLLQRFYDPDEGRVRLDDHDLRDLTLDSVARAVGAVMQDTYLFHASLTDNIRYGRLEATDPEVTRAANAAGMREMIERMPEGLATLVGERGYRLSGGERQRVAIARAILKDPPVLVLDEATASLDSRLEREIHASMRKLARSRTTVVIAHRLSTVLEADEILVLDRGHLVERGDHRTLRARGGLYATLYREQLARDIPDVDVAAG